MANLELISEKVLTMTELKEKLEEIKKRDKELTEKAQRTYEYLNKFSKLKEKEALKLKEEITKLSIQRLKEKHIIKVIDIMPQDIESLKLIFAAENLTIKQEDSQRILETLK